MPKVTTGISINDLVVRKAKKHAAKHRRTFSNYVEGLIMADLGLVINDSDHNKKEQVKLKRRRQ